MLATIFDNEKNTKNKVEWRKYRLIHFFDILSKKEGNDQESLQSSTTADPGYHWESDNEQINITNESQEVSPFYFNHKTEGFVRPPRA